MAVEQVGGGNQKLAVDEPELTPEEQAEVEAAFAQVMGSIGMSLLMNQLNFVKQTADKVVYEGME
jgi:hypothetical protein